MSSEFAIAVGSSDSERSRFWAKVDRSSDCWLWTGARGSEGYGRLTLHQRRFGAHRLAFIWANGAIPDGLVLDHLCRNRLCVRPDHLEPVTVLENTRRGLNGQRTHCAAGHQLSSDNIRMMSGGGKPYRQCRICLKAWKHQAYLRAKSKG